MKRKATADIATLVPDAAGGRTPTLSAMASNGRPGSPSHAGSVPVPDPAHLSAVPHDVTAAARAAVPREFRNWEAGDRFVIRKFLGRGSYGSVVEALDTATNNLVAIKRISNLFDVPENAKRIYREVKLLRLLQHPNIIRLVHLHMPAQSKFRDLYLVFERMDTDLLKLSGDVDQSLTVDHVRWFMYQMLLGVKYIHSAGVIHRDIKPANLLLSESCDLKICDFGLARAVGASEADEKFSGDVSSPHDVIHAKATTGDGKVDDVNTLPPMIHRQLTQHVVTRWYRAPELILYHDGDYDTAIDVWSVGCVFAEMLGMLEQSDPDAALEREALFPGASCYPLSDAGSAATPYGSAVAPTGRDQLNVIFEVLGSPTDATIDECRTEEAKAYLRSLKKKKPKSLADRYPTATPEALDLLNKCLVFTPAKRITVDKALRHPFILPVREPTEEIVRDKAISWEELAVTDIRKQIFDEVALYNTTEHATCHVPGHAPHVPTPHAPTPHAPTPHK